MNLEQEIRNWQQTTDMFRRMGLDETSTLADFGSGKGRYSIAASYTVKKVYALDVSAYALNELRREAEGKDNIEAIQTNSRGLLPFEDNSIDCVLIFDLIHQITSIRDTFLKESLRVLKPGGVLSVLPFHMSSGEIRSLIHETETVGFSLRDIMKREGYHFEMHEWLHGSDGHLKDIERGNLYNFAVPDTIKKL